MIFGGQNTGGKSPPNSHETLLFSIFYILACRDWKINFATLKRWKNGKDFLQRAVLHSQDQTKQAGRSPYHIKDHGKRRSVRSLYASLHSSGIMEQRKRPCHRKERILPPDFPEEVFPVPICSSSPCVSTALPSLDSLSLFVSGFQ